MDLFQFCARKKTAEKGKFSPGRDEQKWNFLSHHYWRGCPKNSLVRYGMNLTA